MGNSQKALSSECYGTCPGCLEEPLEKHTELDTSNTSLNLRGRVHRVFGMDREDDEVIPANYKLHPCAVVEMSKEEHALDADDLEDEGSETTLGSLQEQETVVQRILVSPRAEDMQSWTPPITPSVAPRLSESARAGLSLALPDLCTEPSLVAECARTDSDGVLSLHPEKSFEHVDAEDAIEPSGLSRESSWSLPSENVGKSCERPVKDQLKSLRVTASSAEECEIHSNSERFTGFHEIGTLDDDMRSEEFRRLGDFPGIVFVPNYSVGLAECPPSKMVLMVTHQPTEPYDAAAPSTADSSAPNKSKHQRASI